MQVVNGCFREVLVRFGLVWGGVFVLGFGVVVFCLFFVLFFFFVAILFCCFFFLLSLRGGGGGERTNHEEEGTRGVGVNYIELIISGRSKCNIGRGIDTRGGKRNGGRELSHARRMKGGRDR